MRNGILSLLWLLSLGFGACTSAPIPQVKSQGVELATYNFDYKGSGVGSLTGTVKNASPQAVASVWVKFDVLDSAGNKLGTVRPNTLVGPPAIESLGSGETWVFTFEISGYAGKARSAKPVGIEVR